MLAFIKSISRSMLLGEYDPCPVEVLGGASTQPGLLVCEHAGREVPQRLNSLGLPKSALLQHIAYDIGAEATARLISKKLNTPLIIQRYSRLVIDCNRPPGAADSMPEVSHGTRVPGNDHLDEHQRQSRIVEIFAPFDSQVTQHLGLGTCRWAFSIHSFTPELNGNKRPWDIGLLYREDTETSIRIASAARKLYPKLEIGLNEPYQIDDESDWFVPKHAERLGLLHSLIEIRNDLISTPTGQEKWATIVANLISAAVGNQQERTE
ncbi:MAG: putative N-formylglutamate amidohydrolase [bacterium]